MNKTTHYNERTSFGRMYTNVLYDSHLRALKEIYYDRRNGKRKTDFKVFSKNKGNAMHKTRERLKQNYRASTDKRNRIIHKQNQRLIRNLNKITNRRTVTGSRMRGGNVDKQNRARLSRTKRSKRSESSRKLRRNRTMDQSTKNRNLVIKGNLIRKRMFYRKIRDENHSMSKRINNQKSNIQMKKLEDQFKKNRRVLDRMKRFKFDPKSRKNVMNTCMVFTEGRFRMPGKKYMSFTSTPKSGQNSKTRLNKSLNKSRTQSLRNSRRGSRRSSRRSLRSRKGSSNSLSREFKMGRVSKLREKRKSRKKVRAVSSKAKVNRSGRRLDKSRTRTRTNYMRRRGNGRNSYIDFGVVKAKHINI